MNNKPMNHKPSPLFLAFALLAALAVSACGEREAEPPAATETPAERRPEPTKMAPAATSADDLQSRLADASRPQADRARDASRKPVQVLEFLGIEPGMDVLDLMAGGGWYTEVLSRAVGPQGTVVAHNTEAALRFRDGANEKAISERLTGDRLPNVTRLDKNIDQLTPEDGSFDAAITALNFHDVYNGSGPEAAVAMLRKVHAMLKPGGVFGIIDHSGNAGADNTALHRMDKAKVVESAEAAGFVVTGESDILANDADDRSLPVFDDAIRGKTDRFLLKLQKPGQ
jgi:predicted methyltransferase